jgi:hypothetical protein
VPGKGHVQGEKAGRGTTQAGGLHENGRGGAPKRERDGDGVPVCVQRVREWGGAVACQPLLIPY